MIIIPEIETVVILVPRTGTTSLREAVKRRYPKSFNPYRHMEADGVPTGYDRWRKVGVVRDPLQRLWSLYKYLQTFGLTCCRDEDVTYTTALRESVYQPFEQWLMTNELVFTSPYDRAGRGRFYPYFTVLNALPENRKSQFHYLRPDLGTEILRYDQQHQLCAMLDLPPMMRLNISKALPAPALSLEAQLYMSTWFAWDYGQFEVMGRAA